VNQALARLGPALGLTLRTDLPADAGLAKLADATSRAWTEQVQKAFFNMS
jgi:hypothetical protein